MKFCLLTLISALLVASVFAADAPWFCHDLNCPVFTNQTVDNLEVRSYPSFLWSSTSINSTSYDEAVMTGFQRLFDYISGANIDSKSIEMTSPVLVKVLPGTGPNCNSTFTVSFFVPFEYQTSTGPPKPTSGLIFTETIGPLDVAVMSYDGFSSQSKVIHMAKDLYESVSNSTLLSLREDDGSWFSAGYDPPFRVVGRHNEVWAAVKLSSNATITPTFHGSS